MTDKHEKDIDQLNSFLRGELSAVETYDMAIDKLSDEPAICTALKECQTSHARRAGDLRQEVKRLGGSPAESSGVWGSFAKMVEGGAKMFGKSAAVSVLEEGEDHGLKDYRSSKDELTPAVRQFVGKHLLPEQQGTHDRLSQLQKVV